MRSTNPRTLLLLLAVLAGGELFPAVQEARAQYFGQNRVRWETFDFRVLETEHFDLFHYDSEGQEAAVHVARMSERWNARLSRLLDYEFRQRQPFILYQSHPHFRQTTALTGEPGETTGGVTEPFKRRVVMPMAGPMAETDHVTGHELVHAFQFAMTGVDPTAPLLGAPALTGLPLWFVEGMAEYLSVGPRDPMTAMRLRDVLASERDLPSVRDLNDPFEYFPYRWGHALWAYIAGRWGEERVGEMLRAGLRRGNPNLAITSVLEISPDTLARDWHQAIRDMYGPVVERTRPASDFGEALITEDRQGGSLNVSPALSPDGNLVIFFSERGRFAIDMFLADARTGEVRRQVTRRALDPHFESLEFINSTGSWSPDGRTFAFAAVRRGRPLLTLIEPESGRTVREIGLPGIGEVFNPTWSPDGRRIAFAGQSGGVLDLFVLDVESEGLERLTDDPFSVLHPAWSPDGRRIVFATDRFTSDLASLRFGEQRLALADVETGRIEAVPTLEDGRSVNPQWSPDGRHIYFVSDADGISNLYRLQLETGSLERLTDLTTGVVGITSLSPAISVASETGDVVFSVFEEGNHHIYRLDGGSAGTVARAPGRPMAGGDPAVLPPERRRDARTAELLADATLGLPDPATFDTRPYRGGLGLDFIAQPSLALGFSSFGSFIGGGAALFFSDMLGYHSLATLLQVQVIDGNVLNGIGALGQYLNRRNRLYWGVTAGQIPALTRGFRRGLVDINGDGQQELVIEEIRFWEIQRPVIGVLQYPFSRVLRLELGAGFQQTAYDLQIDQQAFDRFTGRRLLDRTVDAPACGDTLTFREDFCEPSALNQFLGTTALVFDNALRGPTGPLAGQRYRLEVTPYTGTVTYVTGLADYRRYLMPVQPITLAGRILHFGRYGGDADDNRLRRLFLGFPSLIRGYDAGSFNVRNCPPDQPLEECSEIGVFRDLFGTRLAVANAELRIPLLGPIGTLSSSSDIPPLDLIGFFDAGIAWTSDELEQPSFITDAGQRDILTSAGVGLRVNLFGFAIGELDWVHPFERPDRGSYVAFYLTPAF